MTIHEERRFLAGEMTVEDRTDKPPMLTGYAAVFNTLSEELPLTQDRKFREVIRPGAFAESLAAGADVLARFEHQGIIGRTSNGTLRLIEDHRGLRYEIDPADTQAGRDLLALVKRQDVKASSFAFNVRMGGDVWRREGEQLVRELRSVVLLDVSPVIKPAYTATDVAVRSLDAWATEEPGIVSYRGRLALRLAIAERN